MFTDFIDWLVYNDEASYAYIDGDDHRCVRLDKLEDLFVLYLAEKLEKAKQNREDEEWTEKKSKKP